MKRHMKHFLAGLIAYASSVGIFAFANPFSQKTYDNALLLKALGAVAVTTDHPIILDLGGTGLSPASLVVDVSAIDTVTGDESYRIVLEGSPDALFGTAANIATIAEITLGGATGAAPMGIADVTGRYMIPVRNERNGVTYRYLRLRTVVAGTTPTITFIAFLAKP